MGVVWTNHARERAAQRFPDLDVEVAVARARRLNKGERRVLKLRISKPGEYFMLDELSGAVFVLFKVRERNATLVVTVFKSTKLKSNIPLTVPARRGILSTSSHSCDYI